MESPAPSSSLPLRVPRFADTVWLLAEAGFWSEANGGASTCREIYTDERVLLGGTARFVANKALGRTKLHHACFVGNTPRALALLDCGRPSFVDSADVKAKTGRFPELDGSYRLSGMKPLDFAVSCGHAEIARCLVLRGADITSLQVRSLFPGRGPRRTRVTVQSDLEAEATRAAAAKSEALLCELLRLPAVSAGGALKCALRNNLIEIVHENLVAGAIENGWTIEVAGNEGTSFDATFQVEGPLGLRFFPESLRISEVAAGGRAHLRGLRLFDSISHVEGRALVGKSTAELTGLLKAARSDAIGTWTVTVSRPSSEELARMLSETDKGEDLRNLVFDVQQDSSKEPLLRELVTLPHCVVNALEVNRELGSEAWIRELCTEAKLENAQTRDHCFHAAARAGAADLVQECLRRGVDVNSSNTFPAHVDTAILKAAENDHADVVALLCRSPDIDATIALMSACMCGLLEEAELLCEIGADIDFYDEHSYHGALVSSAKAGHTDVVRMLCNRGAFLGTAGSQFNRKMECPLEAACEEGRADAAAVLINAGSDVNCGALYASIENGRSDCFHLLCKSGAAANAAVPKDRTFFWCGRRTVAALRVDDGEPRTVSIRPLALACVSGRDNFAAELLRLDAHRNAADAGGCTALMGACMEGHDAVARLLLSAAAGAVAGPLAAGAPSCAACGGAGSMRCSACDSARYCGAECQRKHWPLHRAACRARAADKAAGLLDALDVNLRDSAGRSALAWACIKRHAGCVQLLLARADLDIAARDARGFSAADLALGHAGILELLSARGLAPTVL